MTYQKIISTLNKGDKIRISGFYFDWTVKIGFSKLYQKECIYAVAQGGLMETDFENEKILSINGIPPDDVLIKLAKKNCMLHKTNEEIGFVVTFDLKDLRKFCIDVFKSLDKE